MKPVFKFLLTILAITGIFSSCDNNKDSLAYYQINGTVTDRLNSQPVNHFRVIRAGTTYLYTNDTIYTDSLGRYHFEFIDYYNKSASFLIKVEDTDDALNGGEYHSQVLTLKFSKSDWLAGASTSEYDYCANKTFDISLTK